MSASAKADSRNIYQNTQRKLNTEGIIGLNYVINHGEEEKSNYSLTEMNSNFIKPTEYFEQALTQFKFIALPDLYKSIVSDSRVLPFNESFMYLVNEYYNKYFHKCLYNYYTNSPTFFNYLFPTNSDERFATSYKHLAFQKFYYLICMIDYVNKYKEDEKMKDIAEPEYSIICNWALSRYDQNMEFHIIGPLRNQTINLDFVGYYSMVISPSNSKSSILDQNMLIKLANIADNSYFINDNLIKRPNVFEKNPDYAKQYVINIDTKNIMNKYIDSFTNENRLLFDLSYIDLSDPNSNSTASRLDDIRIVDKEFSTTSKLNVKTLEKIFNAYSRVSISNMVVNKNTYDIDLTYLDNVYVVFKGVELSKRTINNGKYGSEGDLAIVGTFGYNNNGDYVFKPCSEYTTYERGHVRCKNCKLYLTTDLTYDNNLLKPNIVSLKVPRDDFYNTKLYVVDKRKSYMQTYTDRFNMLNQYPDIYFNGVNNSYPNANVVHDNDYYSVLNYNRSYTNLYFTEHAQYAHEQKVFNSGIYYDNITNIKNFYSDNNEIYNKISDIKQIVPKRMEKDLDMVCLYNYEDNKPIPRDICLFYDEDTGLINPKVLSKNFQDYTKEEYNNLLYNIFMNDMLLNTETRFYNTDGNDYFTYEPIGALSTQNEKNFTEEDKEKVAKFNELMEKITLYDYNFYLLTYTDHDTYTKLLTRDAGMNYTETGLEQTLTYNYPIFSDISYSIVNNETGIKHDLNKEYQFVYKNVAEDKQIKRGLEFRIRMPFSDNYIRYEFKATDGITSLYYGSKKYDTELDYELTLYATQDEQNKDIYAIDSYTSLPSSSTTTSSITLGGDNILKFQTKTNDNIQFKKTGTPGKFTYNRTIRFENKTYNDFISGDKTTLAYIFDNPDEIPFIKTTSNDETRKNYISCYTSDKTNSTNINYNPFNDITEYENIKFSNYIKFTPISTTVDERYFNFNCYYYGLVNGKTANALSQIRTGHSNISTVDLSMLNNYAEVHIYTTTNFYKNKQINEIRFMDVKYNFNSNNNIYVSVIKVSIKGHLKLLGDADTQDEEIILYIIVDNVYFSLYNGTAKITNNTITPYANTPEIYSEDVDVNTMAIFNRGYITSILLQMSFDVSTLLKYVDGSNTFYYDIHVKCNSSDKNAFLTLNRFTVIDHTKEKSVIDVKLIDKSTDFSWSIKDDITANYNYYDDLVKILNNEADYNTLTLIHELPYNENNKKYYSYDIFNASISSESNLGIKPYLTIVGSQLYDMYGKGLTTFEYNTDGKIYFIFNNDSKQFVIDTNIFSDVSHTSDNSASKDYLIYINPLYCHDLLKTNFELTKFINNINSIDLLNILTGNNQYLLSEYVKNNYIELSSKSYVETDENERTYRINNCYYGDSQTNLIYTAGLIILNDDRDMLTYYDIEERKIKTSKYLYITTEGTKYYVYYDIKYAKKDGMYYIPYEGTIMDKNGALNKNVHDLNIMDLGNRNIYRFNADEETTTNLTQFGDKSFIWYLSQDLYNGYVKEHLYSNINYADLFDYNKHYEFLTNKYILGVSGSSNVKNKFKSIIQDNNVNKLYIPYVFNIEMLTYDTPGVSYVFQCPGKDKNDGTKPKQYMVYINVYHSNKSKNVLVTNGTTLLLQYTVIIYETDKYDENKLINTDYTYFASFTFKIDCKKDDKGKYNIINPASYYSAIIHDKTKVDNFGKEDPNPIMWLEYLYDYNQDNFETDHTIYINDILFTEENGTIMKMSHNKDKIGSYVFSFTLNGNEIFKYDTSIGYDNITSTMTDIEKITSTSTTTISKITNINNESYQSTRKIKPLYGNYETYITNDSCKYIINNKTINITQDIEDFEKGYKYYIKRNDTEEYLIKHELSNVLNSSNNLSNIIITVDELITDLNNGLRLRYLEYITNFKNTGESSTDESINVPGGDQTTTREMTTRETNEVSKEDNGTIVSNGTITTKPIKTFTTGDGVDYTLYGPYLYSLTNQYVLIDFKKHFMYPIELNKNNILPDGTYINLSTKNISIKATDDATPIVANVLDMATITTKPESLILTKFLETKTEESPEGQPIETKKWIIANVKPITMKYDNKQAYTNNNTNQTLGLSIYSGKQNYWKRPTIKFNMIDTFGNDNIPCIYHSETIPQHDKVLVSEESIAQQTKDKHENFAIASPVRDNLTELIFNNDFKVENDSYNLTFNKRDLLMTMVFD